jgi:hypothetical protein
LSVRLRSGEQVPSLTAQVARASNPGGTTAMWVRDRLNGLWGDEDFVDWYPQAAEAVRCPPTRHASVPLPGTTEGPPPTRLHRDRREHRKPQRTTTIQRNNLVPTTDRLPGFPGPARGPSTEVLAGRQQLTSTPARSPTESNQDHVSRGFNDLAAMSLGRG